MSSIDRRSEPSAFSSRPTSCVAVLVEQIGDDDARLVQHDMAEPDAVVERQALEADGAAQVEFQPGPRQPRQIAGRDHLGDHHRRRFQRLDLVLAIVALGAVLHDQHAERAAGAQHRHAEEGIVDLFARLRQVGEGRMRLGVRKIERPARWPRSCRRGLARASAGQGGRRSGSDLRWHRVRATNRSAAHRASRPRPPCSGRFRARCGRAAPAAPAAPAMSSRSRLSRTRGPAARSRIGISPSAVDRRRAAGAAGRRTNRISGYCLSRP